MSVKSIVLLLSDTLCTISNADLLLIFNCLKLYPNKPLSIILSSQTLGPHFQTFDMALIVFCAQLKDPDRGNMQLSASSKESVTSD